MPNWCANLLEVNGSVEAKKAFLDAVKGEEGNVFSLTKLKPLPDGKWDYDWCSTNWGTKWDIEAELRNPNWDINDDSNPNLTIVFDSAWGPPDAAFSVLPEMFPDLIFMHMFAEPGMDFSGTDVITGTNRLGDYGEFEYPTISSMVAGYIWGIGNGV
jgi:hypothetical protein